jgi:hypothetical protein
VWSFVIASADSMNCAKMFGARSNPARYFPPNVAGQCCELDCFARGCTSPNKTIGARNDEVMHVLAMMRLFVDRSELCINY